MRQMMWCENLTNALNRNDNRRTQQCQSGDDASQSFGLAITVRMLIIGRRDCHSQSTPDNKRGNNVRCRLDSISNQRIGVAKHTRKNL
jgi:hypothetical protein